MQQIAISLLPYPPPACSLTTMCAVVLEWMRASKYAALVRTEARSSTAVTPPSLPRAASSMLAPGGATSPAAAAGLAAAATTAAWPAAAPLLPLHDGVGGSGASSISQAAAGALLTCGPSSLRCRFQESMAARAAKRCWAMIRQRLPTRACNMAAAEERRRQQAAAGSLVAAVQSHSDAG